MFAAAGTQVSNRSNRSIRSRVKPMAIVGLLALSLTVGAGHSAMKVGAQPVGNGIDGMSQACRAIQNHAGDLIKEYGEVASNNPNDPRLDDILAALRSDGTTWRQIGCQAAFGDIARVMPQPTKGLWGDIAVVSIGGGARTMANG